MPATQLMDKMEKTPGTQRKCPGCGRMEFYIKQGGSTCCAFMYLICTNCGADTDLDLGTGDC